MLDEGKHEMFSGSILDDTTRAREQLNELKGKKSNFLEMAKIAILYMLMYTLTLLIPS